MKFLTRLFSVLAVAVFISGCGMGRSAFTPQSGPPTVGMPAELSERERSFIHNVETALRDRGYMPVRHGAGDMQLEFEMAEGPVNIDTKIELHEGRNLLAKGYGRGAGAPLIGRAKVAEKSFNRAFDEFQSSLSGVPAGGLSEAETGAGLGAVEYVY